MDLIVPRGIKSRENRIIRSIRSKFFT